MWYVWGVLIAESKSLKDRFIRGDERVIFVSNWEDLMETFLGSESIFSPSREVLFFCR